MSTKPHFDKISKAKSRLMMEFAFFARLLVTMPVEIVDWPWLDTAATDGKKIYFSRAYLDECDIQDVISTLVHEICHPMLMHCLLRGNRDPDIWNIAGDHVINIRLEAEVDSQGNRVFFCPKPLMKRAKAVGLANGWYADKKYAGWSTFKVYDDLIQEQQKQPQGGGSDDEGDEGEDEQEGQGGGAGEPGENEGDEQGKNRGQTPGDPRMPTKGKMPVGRDIMESPDAGKPEEAQKEQRRWRGKVAEAAAFAQQAGMLSANMRELVDELLAPTINWWDQLREFTVETLQESEDWRRRNRRFSNVILPGKYDEHVGPILVVADSSGSIWCDKELKARFATEIKWLGEQCKPEYIQIGYFDTEFCGEARFEVGEEITMDFPGGGGTDMKVSLKWAEQFDPQVVILLTDGYTPWPSGEPPYPLLVCCNTKMPVPVGRVIRL